MAVGGGRAGASAWAEREQEERAREWARWEQEQEHGQARVGRGLPRRPLTLDAPPIGCPDHPNGRFADCGPCGTARRRHDKWMAEHRYQRQLEELEIDDDADDRYAEGFGYVDEEPF